MHPYKGFIYAKIRTRLFVYYEAEDYYSLEYRTPHSEAELRPTTPLP